jgi:hypothetical protein
MTPARRLEIAFQAYQFALDTARLTERRNHPELSPEELAQSCSFTKGRCKVLDNLEGTNRERADHSILFV